MDENVQNALKVTYEHLQYHKFSQGLNPRPPFNWATKGIGGEEREERCGDRKGEEGWEVKVLPCSDYDTGTKTVTN